MIIEELRDHAGNLLESGRVGCVIGYELGWRGKIRPVFIQDAEKVNRLVWNDRCVHNLVRYIKEQLDQTKHRVAVVVKPCDSKTINVLLAENRFVRDEVHVIGIACGGMVEETSANGDQHVALQTRCVNCDFAKPVLFDELIGNPAERHAGRKGDDKGVGFSWLEDASARQRMDFWLRQFDRCIRCYACRQACPICDCPTCLFEREDSLWVGSRAETREKRTFHLGRAYHLAGRCVGCNECERVCPMEIPIGLLNEHLAQEMEAGYQHRAGYEQVLSPLTTVLGKKV
jgi:NAD-dependent dihydropyrimidine dehydrogenase PreA subunit